MLDGLFGRKFYTKCKTSIKMTKVRMEVIKKKRAAVEKYLRNDIADLLRNGLDINAYGKAEGLLVELNKSSCYDLIERFYDSISTQLSLMDKHKECPEQCREAVASLMYAAARVADFPELRDLRTMFTKRYGRSIELFVNEKFIEKLSSNPPTKNLKLQLLQDVAADSSIEWNSKALEQKLYTPPEHDLQEKRTCENTYDDYGGHKGNESNVDAVQKLSSQYVDGPNKSSKLAMKSSPEKADCKPTVYSRFMPPPYVRTKPTPPADSDSKEMTTSANNWGENHHQDDSVCDADKPKALPVNQTDDEAAKMNLRGLRILYNNNHKDEEEKLKHGILLHDRKKKSPDEAEKVQTGANHGRAKSLTQEPTTETKAKKGGPRANSFDSGEMNLTGHVHPNLPDCDNLAARIASLSGR